MKRESLHLANETDPQEVVHAEVSSSESLIEKTGAGTRQVVATIAGAAQSVMRFISFSAIVFVIAAVVVWIPFFVPDGDDGVFLIVAKLVGLLAMLGPATVLALFYAGLRQIVSLRADLGEVAGRGKENLSQAVGQITDQRVGRMRRLVRLITALFKAGQAGLEIKGTVLGAAAVARLANPLSMIVVAAALTLGTLLTLVALLVVLV